MSEKFTDFIKKELPLVSVIVPTFNKGQFLAETVKSIADQAYQPIEVLIVDDGSTDNSVVVANELKLQYPLLNITTFSKPNTGISDTRNFAVERANGRVIINLDGDDLMKPTLISEAIRGMRATGANMITSPVEMFGESSETWAPAPYDPFYHRYDNLISTLIIFDKAIWARTGGYSKAYPFNEDWHFSLLAQTFDLHVVRFSEALFRYRVTSSGLANQYIKDSGGLSRAHVATGNQSLYPPSELLIAHDLLISMPEKWVKRLELQDALHQQEWLLKFWLGLSKLKTNNREEALHFFSQAIALSGARDWQPLYHYALLAVEKGQVKEAYSLYHEIRIICPAMRPTVEKKIDLLNLSA